jgi:RNA polymerase sigma factor for flagellar operon FliA
VIPHRSAAGTLQCVSNRAGASLVEQEALILGAYWLAALVVHDLAAGAPRSVDRQDLHSAALLGLVNAAGVYDPTLGVPFDAFARSRMRWAVLDELRAQDPLSRADRRRASARQVAADAPQDHQTVIASRRPADTARPGPVGASDVGDAADSGAISPETHAIERVLVESVRDALVLLTPRCRTVVVAHFIDGRDMRSIADELGVSPSRVSQLCTEGVRRLRGVLRAGNHGESLEMGIAA